MPPKNIAIFLLKAVIGVIAFTLLIISGYAIADHTDDAPNMSVLAQNDELTILTPSPVAFEENSPEIN